MKGMKKEVKHFLEIKGEEGVDIDAFLKIEGFLNFCYKNDYKNDVKNIWNLPLNLHKIGKNNLSKVLDEMGVEYKLLTFETGEDLLREYPENLDILFLDIQMGELTGMETARKVRKYDDKVEIIFITALWDYIQKGYEVRAFRYLIKPVKFKELQEQVKACVENILHKNIIVHRYSI